MAAREVTGCMSGSALPASMTWVQAENRMQTVTRTLQALRRVAVHETVLLGSLSLSGVLRAWRKTFEFKLNANSGTLCMAYSNHSAELLCRTALAGFNL
jgi:hypothetical protein